MIKKYQIDYDYKGDVVIEIDHAIFTTEKVEEINNFWGGAKDRIRDDGTALFAVLKMLAGELLRIELSGAYPIAYGIAGAFDWDKNRGIEGWPKMDGSAGIKIISVDEIYYESNDMKVTEI